MRYSNQFINVNNDKCSLISTYKNTTKRNISINRGTITPSRGIYLPIVGQLHHQEEYIYQSWGKLFNTVKLDEDIMTSKLKISYMLCL